MTTAQEWAEAWKVATAMCQWSPDRTAAYADHAWRHATAWAPQLATADLDRALRTLEDQLAANITTRPTPGHFNNHLRTQASRHLPARTHIDTTPPTRADLDRAARGIALCRWAITEARQGHPPTLARLAAKHPDPHLTAEHGQPDDATANPAHLLAGDT